MPNEEEGDGDEVIPTSLAMNNGKTGEKGGRISVFQIRFSFGKPTFSFTVDCWFLSVSKTENGFRFRFRLHKVTFWGSKNEKLVFVFSFSLHKGRPNCQQSWAESRRNAFHELRCEVYVSPVLNPTRTMNRQTPNGAPLAQRQRPQIHTFPTGLLLAPHFCVVSFVIKMEVASPLSFVPSNTGTKRQFPCTQSFVDARNPFDSPDEFLQQRSFKRRRFAVDVSMDGDSENSVNVVTFPMHQAQQIGMFASDNGEISCFFDGSM